MKELSKSQEAFLYKHRDEFMDNILRHGDKQLDKDKLKKDIDWLYGKAGFQPPKIILVAESYIEEKMMINALFQLFGKDGTNFYQNIALFEDNMRSKMRRDSEQNASRNVHSKVVSDLWDPVENSVSPIDNRIQDISQKIMEQIHEQLKEKFKEPMRDGLWNNLYLEMNYGSIQKVKGNLRENEMDNITNPINNNQYDALMKHAIDEDLWSKAIDSMVSQLRTQAKMNVSDAVVDDVWRKLFDFVDTAVADRIMEQYRRNKFKSEWIEQGFGLPWNSGWLAFYEFFIKIGSIKNEEFTRFCDLTKNFWSMQFFKQWCIVTVLPKRIYRDDENRLHSTDGSVLEWKNNERVHYIHGIYFESDLWEDVVSDDVDPKKILKIQNQEQKQAALSVVPLKTLLDKMGNYKLIDTFKKDPPKHVKKYVKDHDKLNFDTKVKLYAMDGSDFGVREDIKIVHYVCPSTGREYFDFVEPGITKADAAMAWKFNLTLDEYKYGLVVET